MSIGSNGSLGAVNSYGNLMVAFAVLIVVREARAEATAYFLNPSPRCAP